MNKHHKKAVDKKDINYNVFLIFLLFKNVNFLLVTSMA